MFGLEGCLRWPGLAVQAALWLYKEGVTLTPPELGVPILTQSVLFTEPIAYSAHGPGSQQHIESHRNKGFHTATPHREPLPPV